MGIIAWIIFGLRAGLLAACHLVTSRRSERGSGTPVLVWAEKRLYQGQPPPTAQRSGYRDQRTTTERRPQQRPATAVSEVRADVSSGTPSG